MEEFNRLCAQPNRRSVRASIRSQRAVVVRAVASGVFVAIFVIGLLGPATATAAPGRAVERLLVKPKDHLSEEKVQTTLAAHGATEVGRLHPLGVRVVHVPHQRLARVLHALKHHPDIEFAEPDEALAPDAVPNDAYYSNEWHLMKVGAPAAWDLTTGDGGVIIAVLDTGVDGTHPDLVAKMLPGWNVYDDNSDTQDVYGHGTAVAGTAAAISNNGGGVASLAWGCKILPVRISDLNGYATFSAIASGLTYAADQGARVANVSFGASASSTVASAAKYFQSKGGVVAMAAGNEGAFISSADNPYVLTVSATDQNDALASWSNTGDLIDLAAPGVSIYTTLRGGSYGTGTGTSFASPLVAGAAALVISVNPALSGAQVQDILKQSADDLGTAGWDASYGYGRLNVYKAVRAAIGASSGGDATAPAVTINSPSAGSPVSGDVTINANGSDNVGVTETDIYLNGTLAASASSATITFSWDTTGSTNGTWTLQARAHDAAGNVGTSASVTVTVQNSTTASDTIAPVVRITSPPDGARVGGNVQVYVQASDNVGVTRVNLYVDGKYYSSSSSSSPVFGWSTRKIASGAHTLKAVAYDASGNAGTSAVITVFR